MSISLKVYFFYNKYDFTEIFKNFNFKYYLIFMDYLNLTQLLFE